MKFQVISEAFGTRPNVKMEYPFSFTGSSPKSLTRGEFVKVLKMLR